MVVGLRKEEWTKVFYEPISAPEELRTPDLATGVGLYSRSHGQATDNKRMFGEVAWEPLLNHAYFGSSAIAEKRLLQKKILYDAWRYLAAQNPADVALIREQLQCSRRQIALLKALDKAPKARTNSIRQKEQRRARKAQRLGPNVPAQSIELSDDDSGLGSDIEDDDEENIDSEDGGRMSSPSHTVRRPPLESHRRSVTQPSPMMSGGLSNSSNANNDMAFPSSQTNAAKRNRSAGPELQPLMRARRVSICP